MKKKILILGGKPVSSIDIVQYAKKLGCYVIVCDNLPAEQSSAKEFADEVWNYSTADIDIIVENAKSSNVDAVFTGVHDFNIQMCQIICERLNLPFYATKEQLRVTSNKRIYKELFRACNIPIIQDFRFSSIDDIPLDIEYPILIKPVDSTGSYGLQICNNREDVREKLNHALHHSKSKEIIIEEYIKDKEEITALYIINNGISYLSSVADRLLEDFGHDLIPLPCQYIWNSKYLKLYQDSIDLKMKQAIQKMNLVNGVLFIQAIVKDDVIMPYDVGFRLSGTQEHIIIDALCNYSPLKLMVNYALTEKFIDEELIKSIDPEFRDLATQITFLVKPSKILKFVGIEEVENLNGVIKVVKNKYEGDIVPESACGTLNQIALRVFVKAKNKEILDSLVIKIRELIKIYSITGKEIGI